MGWLILKDPDGMQQTVEIPRESPLVVGRSSRAHISIDGTTVSRKHALFQHKKKADWVQDAGSRNGTLFNGQALTRPRRLDDGDCIEVGEHRLFYARKNPAGEDDDDDTDIDESRPLVDKDAKPLISPASDARLMKDGRRWRQVTLIGRGGMGEVYRAFDRDLGELVAVKRLRRAGDGGARSLLEALHAREAAIGRTINHPNVVRVLEDGVHDGDPFLLLEWVEGKSLDRELREGPARLGSALEILRQTALGLEAAHAAGVVHADMKPANLLVYPEYDEEWLMTNLDILESPEQALRAKELSEDWVEEIQKRAPEPEEPDFGSVPFVGREGELALLTQIAEEAKSADEVRWVLLLGAQGVGKKQLVDEFESTSPGIPVHVTEELHGPTRGAGAHVHITLLPATLPADAAFLRQHDDANREGIVFELYLKPFLRGQSIRLVERVVGHPESSRAFVDAVEQETGGYPGRIIEVLERSFTEGAWTVEGGGYRFRGQRYFNTDEGAATRLLLEEFERGEKGLQDLLVKAAPLGASMDFDTLQVATGIEAAALYYLLGHGVKAGFLTREAGGTYRFTLEPFRLTLVPRQDDRARLRVIRSALPVMTKRLEQGDAALQLYLDTATLEEQEGHRDRAFRWYLEGALRARTDYDRHSFIRCVDGARQTLKNGDRSRPSRSVMALLEDHLGSAGRGLSGLDRLRKLPTQVRVKVADFGVARRTDESNEGANGKKTAWGTPRYMSPEQANKEALTPASDVFSLGIVGREMIEGVHPLGDLKGRGAIVAITGGALGELAGRSLGAPEEVRRLLVEMLDVDASRRPTAAQVARRIQAIQVRLSTSEYS